ncbi:MAG: hypothetical protein RR290_03260 [Clostridia bacterium]
MKPFKTGFMVGRFQHIHLGHEKLINIGISLCDIFVVFVSSSDKLEEIRNPYNIDYRISLIKKIYSKEIEEKKLIIFSLCDLTCEEDLTPLWGRYVIDEFKKNTNLIPECIIYGKDKNIDKCFSKKTVENITEVFVDRKSLEISATQMREYLLNDDIDNWKKYSNSKIHDEYNNLRNKLLLYKL